MKCKICKKEERIVNWDKDSRPYPKVGDKLRGCALFLDCEYEGTGVKYLRFLFGSKGLIKIGRGI